MLLIVKKWIICYNLMTAIVLFHIRVPTYCPLIGYWKIKNYWGNQAIFPRPIKFGFSLLSLKLCHHSLSCIAGYSSTLFLHKTLKFSSAHIRQKLWKTSSDTGQLIVKAVSSLFISIKLVLTFPVRMSPRASLRGILLGWFSDHWSLIP